MTFNTDIEKTEKEIAVLQAKLELLKEIEVHKSQVEKEPDMMLMRQGNVDIVDYDHKVYYRIEYTDSFSGTYVWFVRRRGDENIRQVRDVNVYGVLEDYYQKEVLKQKEEYPYKKYTPEETAKELRDAMRKAKEDGVFVVDDPPEYDVIEWDEKDNPKTLLQIIREWCDDDNDPTCEELVNRISRWLPKSFESCSDYDISWNDCLNEIKEKLK
jgi:hypothetical protein